jgi:hypothetical protein
VLFAEYIAASGPAEQVVDVALRRGERQPHAASHAHQRGEEDERAAKLAQAHQHWRRRRFFLELIQPVTGKACAHLDSAEAVPAFPRRVSKRAGPGAWRLLL